MANKVVFSLIIGLITACNVQTNHEKISRKLSSDIPSVSQEDFKVDMGIKNIVTLMREDSPINKIRDKTYLNDYLFLSNADFTECLVLQKSGTVDEYSQCDLFSMNAFKRISELEEYGGVPEKFVPTKLETPNFSSNFGIKLGMKESEVAQLMGKKYMDKSNSDKNVWTYILDDPKSSVLSENNMPEYDARFYFEDGILTRYTFGFPTP